jgi:glycosyltransferase involved in cell wall biosynthesis
MSSPAPDRGIVYALTQPSLQSGATYAMAKIAALSRDAGYRTLLVGPWTPDVSEYLKSVALPSEYLWLRPLRRPGALLDNLRLLVTAPWHVFRFIQLTRRFGAALVHVNEVTDLIPMIAGRLSRKPVVVHVRAHFPTWFQSWLSLSLLRIFATSVIVPSRSVFRWIEKAVPRLAERTEIIYEVAFDADVFRRGRRETVRSELRLPPSQPMVLLVSKLGLLKGHLLFLEAISRLTGEAANVTFVIVGDVMTGRFDEAELIRERARSLSGRLDVRMLGLRRDLPDVMAAADVFVHCPVYPDPFPTVVPQAMSLGRAVIGSAIGGIVEQIEHEKTGLLVPAEDPDALAVAIERLVLDSRLRADLGRSADLVAREHFSDEAQRKAQLAHYERVLGEAARSG